MNRTAPSTISDDYNSQKSSSRPGGFPGIIQWWYHFAGPREVPPNASFKQREVVRRGRTASFILLVVILLVVLPIPGALDKPNVLIALLIVLAVDLGAVFLNKLGKLTTAGIIVIFTIEFGLLGTILSIPGGANSADLPLFDLMIQAEIVAVAMLAPGWVFFIMGLNIGLIWAVLHSQLLSPELSHLLTTSRGSGIFIQAFEIQIIIAVFAFILVQGADIAIRQLDRAEEIVALERREIERQEGELVLKQQLENGIQQLMQTHVRAANGDFTARAPLNRENVLWQVAYSLNNLLSRLERNNQLQIEMKRTQEAVRLLAQNVRFAKANKQPLQLPPRTGTIVDELIVELTLPNVGPDQPQATRPRPSLESASQDFFREASHATENWLPQSRKK